MGSPLNGTIFPTSHQHLPTRGFSVSSAAVYSIGLGRSESDKTVHTFIPKLVKRFWIKYMKLWKVFCLWQSYVWFEFSWQKYFQVKCHGAITKRNLCTKEFHKIKNKKSYSCKKNCFMSCSSSIVAGTAIHVSFPIKFSSSIWSQNWDV